MPDPLALIVSGARSAVAPRGGAFGALEPHTLAAPVLTQVLERAGVPLSAVNALVVGNALGAGGNPARMLAQAARLPAACAAYSVDTQCCSGLDAITLAVGLIASGQAGLVVAGGVEAWSRAPLRMHRPRHPGEAAQPYERPAFAPEPAHDPDLSQAAADYAAAHGWTRTEQDDYALASHQRACAAAAWLAQEIVAVQGVAHDPYPRLLAPERARRLPLLVRPGAPDSAPVTHPGTQQGLAPGLGQGQGQGQGWKSGPLAGPQSRFAPVSEGYGMTMLGISASADAAAFVVLASAPVCQQLGLRPRAQWLGAHTLGGDARTPLVLAQEAAQACLVQHGVLSLDAVPVVELHDAYAVQGLAFCRHFGLAPQRVNRHGGGLARGHPIAASAAVATVRALTDLGGGADPGDLALVAVAGAGGIGTAALLRRL